MPADFNETVIAQLKKKIAALQNSETGGVTMLPGSPNEISGFWLGTEAQYQALGTKDPDGIYLTTS